MNKKSILITALVCIISIALGFVGGVVFEKSTDFGRERPMHGGMPGGRGVMPPDNAENTGGEITEEQAKKIALEKAGLSEAEVKFLRVEKDFDDGMPVYEVEFVSGNNEYSAEIMLHGGRIQSWEAEIR